ncbi:unnamed protein product [Musa acuminata subsp. burmannicoides]
MVRNAHLLGFFRRICKLLFLRTKPVFVFDGATPALKRRTVAARRLHRDRARAKIRKTAEKLLLNHLKAKRLEELAAEIKKQKEGSKEKQITDEDTKGKKVLDSNDEIGAEGSSVLPRGDMESGVSSQENLDELLAASLAAEEEMEINKNVLTSEGGLDEAEDDNDDNEEMIYPMDNIHIDPAVLASLPPTMQLDLLVQMRESIMAENRQKYQKIKKDSHKQAGIVYNGGLVPLLKLLDPKNGCLQHNAAFALYGIAENEDNVSDFIKVGGVQKLQDGEFIIQATKDCVAKTMKRLEEKINGPVLKHLLYLMRVGEKAVQRRITLALAHLCSPEDQRTIFMDDDGLNLILELLGSTDLKQQQDASVALYKLAKKSLTLCFVDAASPSPSPQVC